MRLQFAHEARKHIATSTITSGWWQDVFVYKLHETRTKGQYSTELLEIFRYSHRLSTQPRDEMLEDALENFCNHHLYKHTLHQTGTFEGRPTYNFGSTTYGYERPHGFGPGQHISISGGPGHRVFVIAVIGSLLTQEMIQRAVEYAESQIKKEEK